MAATVPAKTNFKMPTIAAHAAFVPIGVVTVILGPMLPALSARWSLDYAQAGSLFTVQFVAATLGVVLSGLVVHHWGYRLAITLGLVAMVIGVSALTAHFWQLGVAGVSCYGFGLGLAIPACNLMVAKVNPERRSAALNQLNLSWSVGAVVCPFLIAHAVKRGSLSLLLYVLAGLMLLIALVISKSSSWDIESVCTSGDPPKRGSAAWNDRFIMILSLLFFLYVGVENAIGGWAASYAKTIRGGLSTFAVASPSFYYAALMCGRLLAPFVLRKVPEITVARAGLLVACLGMAGLVLAGTLPAMVVTVTIIGLGLSAVYPITISLLSKRFSSEAPRIGSLMFTIANFGGATLPWLVGYSSTLAGSLRIGLLTPLAGGLSMLALYPRAFGNDHMTRT